MRPTAREDHRGSFPHLMMKNFKTFDESSDVPASVKWGTLPPENSMAWRDLKKGSISSLDRVKSVNLPPPIARMMAEDARKRSFTGIKKPKDAKTPWSAPPKAQPLMSLNLQPPSASVAYFNPQILENRLGNSPRTMGDDKMLNVLTQVNVTVRKIAEIMGTTVQARIERRKSDNAMCLFAYFNNFPWAVVGGAAVIDEEFVGQPPPPYKIYETWRVQLFQSLKAFFPPPLLARMKRNVDKGVNMEWNMKLVMSDDFQEILKRVTNLKQHYERLWNTDPTEFDYRDIELVTMRSSIIRQIDTEVRSFWTYDKTGVYLKMNV